MPSYRPPVPNVTDTPYTEWIGAAAACLTTASFVPQAWLTYRTRDVSGISLGMYSAFTLGVALWLVYGILVGSWPVTAANAVTLTLALLILSMRIRYGARPPV
jgi:MtN3 and saliva related transmembrane protein